MIITYYNILFVISVFLMLVMAARYQIRIDVDFAVFFLLVPIDILGYIRIATAQNIETALLANNLVYLGGCFLQLFAFLSVCNLCQIRLSPVLRAVLFGISIAMYTCTLTMGHTDLFYKNARLGSENGISVIIKEYGPMHKWFYVMIVIYLIATLVALIYAYFKKPEASVRNMYLMALMMFICVAAFFTCRMLHWAIELSPACYVVTEVVFLIISRRIRLYNITGDIAENVLERGADGLVCFDLSRRLLVTNKTAQEMIPEFKNAQADHCLNETIDPFRQISGCLFRFIEDENNSEDTITNGEEYYQINIRYIKDGNKKRGYYAVLRNVTTERKYIESINNYNEQMRNAADAAIAADNAKTMFLAQMSHEIRTPINAVLGMNEMIMQETDDDTIFDYASAIQTSGRTLLFLINSILDFSKIEDGKMEIYETEYDLVTLINNLVNSTASSAEAKGLKFDVDIDENLPVRMIGDDMRITQVIVNLLSNAVKYTDEGTVSLRMSVNSSFNPKSDDSVWVHVEVKDTGIGIRKEDQDRMFDSFERLDVTRNRNVEGTGLGMTIVYKLLDLMGSHIYLESVYGKGSKFWFDISQKVVDPTPMGSYRERRTMAEMRAKKHISLYAPDAKILVVDDNTLNLKVTRAYLKLCGIVPDEALSGKEAIGLMKENTCDVVFLDHMMPEMDGVETLKAIREQELAPPNTVMVVLTANAVEGSREMYMNEGFDDYISKPVELTDMVAKLDGYLKMAGRDDSKDDTE